MKRVLFVLGQLSDHDIDWMINNGRKIILKQGDYLVQEGQSIEEIYIVLSGHFRIFNQGAPDMTIAQIGSGEIMGEMTFLDERPPSVSVMATDEASVFCISLDKVKQRMEVDNQFAARFYYSIALFLSDRLRKTTSRLGYGDPAEDADEINLNVMTQVGKAGARFSRMLLRFSES